MAGSQHQRSRAIDDLHARTPIDKTAAMVVGRGFHYEPAKRVMNNDSDMPIATREIRKVERNAQGFKDLTNTRYGRFVVLGPSRDHSAAWVVRCTCGRYSTRTAKAIKNPANAQDRCEHCRHLAFLKRENARQVTGRNQDIKDF